MKLFLDTANLDEIREGHRWGVLSGVTTNPTLISKEASDFLPLVKEICSIVDGDVSIETSSNEADSLVRQGHDIMQIADNAVVKIAANLPNGKRVSGRNKNDPSRMKTTAPSARTKPSACAENAWQSLSEIYQRKIELDKRRELGVIVRGSKALRKLVDTFDAFLRAALSTTVLLAATGPSARRPRPAPAPPRRSW